ncbi:MAG TPA: TolC family protein [Bacteroidia bacterium]|jgi:outer membrane protein TolC|nr:TolC family protein [Bacteroidia bacterium]
MKRFVIIWAIVGTLTATAQDPGKETAAFSLQQAIDYAMQNQKDVKNAILEEQIAKQKIKEIRGSGFPQINASYDFKYWNELPTQVIYGDPRNPFAPPSDTSIFAYIPLKFGTFFNSSAGIDASQLLFSGEYLVGLKASKVYAELSSRSTQRTKIETVSTVTKAYYTALINEERMNLLTANITRLKRILDETKALYENGIAEKLDFDRLTVTYNNLVVEQEKIKRFVALSINLLKFQIGLNAATTLTLTDKLADVKFDATQPTAADKFDYEKRVEFSLFDAQFKLAKLDLKRNQASFLPTAVAYGALNYQRFRQNLDVPSSPWYSNSFIGAKVSLPIFTGFQRNSKVQQAKLKVIQAQNNIDFIKQTIDLEISSSFINLQNASSMIEVQKKNIAIAEDVARVTKIKYEQGTGTNLEVITAETALIEAQTNYYSALFDALVAKIDYEKANGNITK